MAFPLSVLGAILKRGLSISIPVAWTGYRKDKPMSHSTEDLIKLIDAICVAFDNPDYLPEYDDKGVLLKTHCNRFVNSVAMEMGCYDLCEPITKTAYLADDMIRVIDRSDNWQEMRCAGLLPDQMPVALRSIQAWANMGYLMVAAASSTALGGSHGHICIVRPGRMRLSGKWGQVPVVANVGRENFIGRAKLGPMKGEPVGVNEAFVSMPRFYCWKGA
jgi:hypothetical protein